MEDRPSPAALDTEISRRHEFDTFSLSFSESMYDALLQEYEPYLEHVTNGRKGCISTCVNTSSSGNDNEHSNIIAALVRSTTKYQGPMVRFSPSLHRIKEELENIASVYFPFNNALVEEYTNKYKSMKFHSDQDLDLQEGTYIALFSSYRDPNVKPTRYLEIKNKETQRMEMIPLQHHSVVVFDVDRTNKAFQHRIVYKQQDDSQQSMDSDNAWIGITFRQSKTLLEYKTDTTTSDPTQSQVFFHGTTQLLRLASPKEIKDSYRLRQKENDSKSKEEFSYGITDYTTSPGDLLIPV